MKEQAGSKAAEEAAAVHRVAQEEVRWRRWDGGGGSCRNSGGVRSAREGVADVPVGLRRRGMRVPSFFFYFYFFSTSGELVKIKLNRFSTAVSFWGQST